MDQKKIRFMCVYDIDIESCSQLAEYLINKDHQIDCILVCGPMIGDQQPVSTFAKSVTKPSEAQGMDYIRFVRQSGDASSAIAVLESIVCRIVFIPSAGFGSSGNPRRAQGRADPLFVNEEQVFPPTFVRGATNSNSNSNSTHKTKSKSCSSNIKFGDITGGGGSGSGSGHNNNSSRCLHLTPNSVNTNEAIMPLLPTINIVGFSETEDPATCGGGDDDEEEVGEVETAVAFYSEEDPTGEYRDRYGDSSNVDPFEAAEFAMDGMRVNGTGAGAGAGTGTGSEKAGLHVTRPSGSVVLQDEEEVGVGGSIDAQAEADARGASPGVTAISALCEKLVQFNNHSGVNGQLAEDDVSVGYTPNMTHCNIFMVNYALTSTLNFVLYHNAHMFRHAGVQLCIIPSPALTSPTSSPTPTVTVDAIKASTFSCEQHGAHSDTDTDTQISFANLLPYSVVQDGVHFISPQSLILTRSFVCFDMCRNYSNSENCTDKPWMVDNVTEYCMEKY